MMFKKVVLSFIFGSIILLISSLFIPVFVINNNIGIVGEKYVPDIKVYNVFFDLTDKVIIYNNVDDNKVGTYQVECIINFLFMKIRKKFYVDIIDDINPSITLLGDNPSTVCPFHDYKEEGYTASDNYDGDISDRVKIIKYNNSILYIVKDSSGNETKYERKIIFEDSEKPSISLIGSSVVTVYLGDKYYEKGYTASDNCDGNISDKVISTGTVDTSKLGSYIIKYEISDSNGNTSSIERTVIVKKRGNYYGNGNIYLTFDDGPSYLTNEILDILDEENIKVTFFVTTANEYTRRAYNSGHTIALHSYTHDYSYIYSNSDNYFNDLNNISDSVYNVIGIKPKIIRFPGGSSNTISRKYNKGIMSYLTTEVVNRGYTYFDWNIDSNDAGSDIYNSDNIYYNVINNLSHNKTNVVLMHDSGSHSATAKALRNIISYGKEYGYSFKSITEDTPLVIHGVNN